MPLNTDRFKRLLQGYYLGSLTSVEYEEFWQLFNENEAEPALQELLKEFWKDAQSHTVLLPDAEWNRKMRHLQEHVTTTQQTIQPRRVRASYKWAAVFLGFLLIGGALFLFLSPSTTVPKELTHYKKQVHPSNDLQPGSNKAILTLSDGSTIPLDDSENGLLAMQGKTNIIKQQDGQIAYNASSTASSEIVYNVLSTPRGGQFKITLPDGSKVWLNASTTLKYPVVFVGKERKVEVNGEAYFEVAKDITRPFIVEANQEKIEVLGTHFNVNNYSDEDLIKTTLLEGSINLKVNTDQNLLKPGQQAQLNKAGAIKVTSNVDLEEIIAWKEGNFQFEDENIKTIMRQIARWYDVEVEFRGNVNKHFGGVIARNVVLSKVLDMLQMTGEVKFTISGKKVFVEEP